MVVSAGMRSSSTSFLTKSKSVFDADGKPTSISFRPSRERTSRSRYPQGGASAIARPRFAGRTPILPGRVNDEVLAEVRAIGATTASAPGIHERDTVAARVTGLLADPDDPEARDQFIRWAERTAVRGPSAEMRSAARLLLTLLRDGAPPATLHTVDPP